MMERHLVAALRSTVTKGRHKMVAKAAYSLEHDGYLQIEDLSPSGITATCTPAGERFIKGGG